MSKSDFVKHRKEVTRLTLPVISIYDLIFIRYNHIYCFIFLNYEQMLKYDLLCCTTNRRLLL